MSADWKWKRCPDLRAVAVLLVLVSGLALAVRVSGRAYLPRHPAAHDLPWAQTSAAAQLTGEPYNRSLNDKVNLIYPDYAFTLQELRAGRLPLWNPWILCGVPHAANPMTAVFYPPNWILALFDPVDACLIAAALHVFVAGAGMYLFLRMAGPGSSASLAGALGFAFCGWMAAHLHNTPLAAVVSWIPAGLAGVEARLQGRRGPWLLLTALSTGMMWLAGFPQFAVLGCLFLGLYGAIGIGAGFSSGTARAAGRCLAGLMSAVAIGLLLAAIQLVPTFELLERAARQGNRSGDDLVHERFRMGAWTGLVLPSSLGDPMAPIDWTRQLGARIALGEGPDRIVPKIANWSERTVYPGIAVLLLALIGARHARSRAARTLLILMLAGAVLACLGPAIRLMRLVPGFDFGAPARAVLICLVCFPALAAFGCQRIIDQPPGRGIIMRILALLSVASVALALFALLAGGACLDWLAQLASRLDPDEASGSSERLAEVALAALRTDSVRLAVLFPAAWLFLLALRRGLTGPRFTGLLLVILIAVDLLFFFIPVNLPVSKDRLFEATPALRYLKSHLGDGRMIRISESDAAARSDVHRLLPPNMASLYRLADVQGYREQVPRDYLQLWRETAAWILPVGMSGLSVERVDSGILDLAGVHYLLAARPIESMAARQVHPESGPARSDLWIYEHPDPLPRAFVVHRFRVLPDETAREAIQKGQVDPRQEVLLAEPPADWDEPSPDKSMKPAKVRILRNLPGELVCEVASTASGFLVIRDTWFPGWRAWVHPRSGPVRTAPVLRAMTCFRAVPIEAGEQVVTLTYRPASVKIGGCLSIAGLVGLAGLWRAGRRRKASIARDA